MSAPATRFDTAFAARGADDPPALMPYLTAGFPERESLSQLLLAAQHGGALAAEVGIPFSDPLADGPTIQRAGTHALQNGMTLRRALEQVHDARAGGVTIPLAVMTYLNLVLAIGVDVACRAAHDAGADALIVPDLPHVEAAEVREAAQEAGLALVPLVAPTTPRARLGEMCATGGGFVYCVSVTGVTGAREALPDEAIALLEAVRSVTNLPRALGFGLSRPEHLIALRGHADAGVVGSALIDAIDGDRGNAAAVVESFCRAMTAAH